MNSDEAKHVLLAYRGRRDDGDPEVAEALELVRRDPALQEWLDAQKTFHAGATAAMNAIPVPARLQQRLAARARIISPPWWRQPPVWAAAAAIVLLGTFLALQFQPAPPGNFPIFRSRMVGIVLRQYTMDIVTNDMAAIRRHLAAQNAPADYSLPPGLSVLPPSGAGVLSWQGERVSMVCLNGGKEGTLFLFVASASDVTGPPMKSREFAQVNALATVSWIDRGKLYVLPGEAGTEALKKYL